MFEVGDKVICINPNFKGMFYGEVCTIIKIWVNNKGEQIFNLNMNREGYNSSFFVPLNEYRRYKIEKIKERICLKKVIK